MPLGPIELVALSFPGSRFSGKILPALRQLVESGTITIVDGLLVSKDLDGSITFVEIEEAVSDADPELAELTTLFDRVDGLLSDEDVEELAEALEPGDSEAILIFENTWMKPLQEALADAGAVLAVDTRIPNEVVDEVLAAVAELD